MEITDPDDLLLIGLAGCERARYHNLSDQFEFILKEVWGEAVTALIAGFKPGTSPPPVRMPIVPFEIKFAMIQLFYSRQQLKLNAG